MGHSGDTTQTGAPTGDRSRDPFAPPPAGTPDRPWQPRGPVVPQGGAPVGGGPVSGGPVSGGQAGGGPRSEGDGQHDGAGAPGQAGASDPSGTAGTPGTARPEGGTAGTPEQGGAAGTPEHGAAPGPQDGTPPARGRAHVPVPPPHPWSPGYQGQQPPTPRFQYQPPGPRFDPTDPVMRRSRYAVLCGIWGVPFMVLGIPYVSLLLGALAIYWGISALRGTPKPPNPLNGNGTVQGDVLGGSMPGQAVMPPTSPYHPAAQTRPQVPAALVGIVGGVVSLSLVAAVFAVQLYYKNYYDCQTNALTKAAYDSCATSVSPRPPVWLTQFNGE